QESQTVLELANGSRIVSLPGREQTIRSFSGVNLLVLDEAARIPDDLYRSVRPMLAVSRGRLVAPSTPFGQRGWFYEEWHGGGPWKRVRITWRDCPRITPEFIAEETRALGPAWVDQEYNACFTALEGLVYPDFEQAVVDEVVGLCGGEVVGKSDSQPHHPKAGASAASTSAGATRSRRCGAHSTATTCCGSRASATAGSRRCTSPGRRRGRGAGCSGPPTPPAAPRPRSCAPPASTSAAATTTSAWASPPSPPGCAPAASRWCARAAPTCSPKRSS